MSENPKRKIILKGPSGYGLAINPDMKGHYVIIACGTGVLPFLDFFYFLLKKVSHEYFGTKDLLLKNKFNTLKEDYANMFVHGEFELTFFGAFSS
jgi:hypothetical protein